MQHFTGDSVPSDKKMKKIPLLIIEDDSERIRWFEMHMPQDFRAVPVQSAGRAIGLLSRDSFPAKRKHVYGGILMDHDLDMQTVMREEHSFTGSHVIEAIIRHISNEIPVLVHSMNPQKAPGMVNKLNGAGFNVLRLPYADLTPDLFAEWIKDLRENWVDLHEE